MSQIIIYLAIGLLAGTLSGLFGIGGAIIMIPALVFLCGFEQHLAQGTSLMLMLPPIGLLAAIEYYKRGYVNIKAAVFICVAFFIGAFFGAKGAIHLPTEMLKKLFACFLMFIAVRMFMGK
jgi:uncharacterized membrane protein YfcA